jgi:hypothetical protein
MKNDWLLYALGVFILAGTGTAVYVKTKGLRLNNPGNLRRTNDAWQGLATPQSDPEFFEFIAPEYGVRAMARTLLNYQQNYGLNSIRDLVSRWAPPTENDTDSYVNAVASRLGVSPDLTISVASALPALIPAMIVQEQGLNPYPDKTILTGIRWAMGSAA